MDAYDAIVVGSGAGGALLARELARGGASVLVLERGEARRDGEKGALKIDVVTSRQGVPIMRALAAGGTTAISAGNMVPCLVDELAALGIDIGEEIAELQQALRVAPLDPSLRHEACSAIEEAGRTVGLVFSPMVKCIKASLCDGCGMCLKGCPNGARWSAAETIAEAELAGATVLYGTECTGVLREGDKAVGVTALRGGNQDEYRSPLIILCAGGLETPVLLQAVGLDAGRRLSVDLLAHVYGFVAGATYSRELPMPLVCSDLLAERGFILSPNINYGAVARHIREAGIEGVGPHNALGIMIKIRDSAEGRVYPDGSVSKRVTDTDKAIFDDAMSVARDILIAAGADPHTVFDTPINGAHPLGTAAIGEVVSTNLETRIRGLFVCDASVLPTAPGLPPILTIMALSLRLSRHLLHQIKYL
jgi:choline dehydrogenase-like flavoprotein